MYGSRASSSDTCWASLGFSNLGNSHFSVLYLNMAPGPHRLGISAFCLFTSSIHHPLFFADPSLPLSVTTFSPETTSFHPSRRFVHTHIPNVSHFHVSTSHQLNCSRWFADSKVRESNPVIGQSYSKYICYN